MAINQPYSGSISVDTTEMSLLTGTSTPGADGTDCSGEVVLDLSSLASGDSIKVTAKEKATLGSAQGVAESRTYAGPGLGVEKFPIGLMLHGWDVTVKKMGGVTRTIPYSIRTITDGSAGMASAALKQHVVEFKPGIGKVTDGVVDATSLNGPWNWTPPLGTVEGMLTASGPGGAGMGGAFAAGMTSAGAGSGGSCGVFVFNLPVCWVPGATITIVAGARNAGGAVNSWPSQGGETSIQGLLPTGAYPMRGTPLAIRLFGGGNSAGLPTASTTGAASYGAGSVVGDAPYTNLEINQGLYPYSMGIGVGRSVGGMGGGGNANSATPGGVGRPSEWPYNSAGAVWPHMAGASTSPAGVSSGGVSRGGGGCGQSNMFGIGGQGGSGAAGEDGVHPGVGGGGGAGGYPGGAGGPSYIRFTYWSTE
jgi:hypothetical protein